MHKISDPDLSHSRKVPVLDFRDLVVDVGVYLRLRRRRLRPRFHHHHPVVAHVHAVEVQDEHGGLLDFRLEVETEVQVLARRPYVEQFGAEVDRRQGHVGRLYGDAEGRRVSGGYRVGEDGPLVHEDVHRQGEGVRVVGEVRAAWNATTCFRVGCRRPVLRGKRETLTPLSSAQASVFRQVQLNTIVEEQFHQSFCFEMKKLQSYTER